MKSLLLRPSLSRRLFVTLIFTFLLTCVVLTSKEMVVYYLEEMQVDGDTGKVGAVLASSLREVADRSQAIAAVKTLEDQFNLSYAEGNLAGKVPPRVFVQLATAAGDLLYESEALGYLLTGDDHAVLRVKVNGRAFDLFSYNDGPWSLRLALPTFKKHEIFAAIFMNLAPYMALSFPVVMLPLWIAIRRGLRPLDKLSKKLATRRDDDLSPLAVDMKYAELEGVVDAFESLLDRLRRKIESERSFMQDAAHELRTPMAVISAQGHVLAHADDRQSREQAGKALGVAITRASHLSEQLLSLASLDHSRYLDKAPLDIAFVLQNLLAGMAPAAIARRVEMALEAPESLPMPMNRMAFHSIVQNLVDNALRYGVDGGHIVVSLLESEHAVELRVADDGPGISAADREHIFDRFFRGKEQNVTGTGLGLAIVDKATRAMGGSVRVDRGIDSRGVSFVVSFPKLQSGG